jgi:hypothetical protein
LLTETIRVQRKNLFHAMLSLNVFTCAQLEISPKNLTDLDVTARHCAEGILFDS